VLFCAIAAASTSDRCIRTNGWSEAMRKKFGAMACGSTDVRPLLDAVDVYSNSATNNPLVSNAELAKIMPGASAAKIAEYSPYLNSAMQQAGINTPDREAAFLAQLGHESGSFKYMQELASGKAYEGRKDLGNTQPGDGVKYKGRGPIQITGRANYAAAGKALGIDLVNNPALAATPAVGFRVAAWYWNSHNLNQYADLGTQAGFDKITKIINGGYNGKADRDSRYNIAKQQLGAN